jgi:hypothetical protein
MFLAVLFGMAVFGAVAFAQGIPYYDRDFLGTFIPATATLLGFVGAILAIVFPALRRPVSQIQHRIQTWTRIRDQLESGELQGDLKQIAQRLPWYVIRDGSGPIKTRVTNYLGDLKLEAKAVKAWYLSVLLRLIGSAMVLALALVLAMLHLKLLLAWSFANSQGFTTFMSGMEMGFLAFSTVLLVAGLYRSVEMAGYY